VIAAEPGLAKPLVGEQLDTALETLADFGDLKSPWFTGHSRGVARLATAAAQEAGLPDEAVTELHRAALIHDLGRTGVPNTIWDKPGPLTDAEWERVRLHPYYAERMLGRPEALARSGAIALAAAQREMVDFARYATPSAASGTTTAPSASPAPSSGGGNCTPGYSPCIPPGPDVDCAGGGGDGPRYVQGPVRVTGSDPYYLDGNGDGVGCE
jgi:HD domain